MSKPFPPKHDDWVKNTLPKHLPKHGNYKLSDFNYAFNEKGELRHVPSKNKFFYWNERHYNAVGEAVGDFLEEEMMKLGLNRVIVDKNGDVPIFVSKSIESCDKVIVLIMGSGEFISPGMWARAVVINDNLEEGSMLPYIRQGIKDGYGILVLNPNQNMVRRKPIEPKVRYNWNDPAKPKCALRSECNIIVGHENRSNHFQTVWKLIISPLIERNEQLKIAVVAHSAGGYAVLDSIRKNPTYLKHIRCIAFSDSVSSCLDNDPPHVKEFLRNHCVNWAMSMLPLDTVLEERDGPVNLSGGVNAHAKVSGFMRSSCFNFINTKLNS